MMAGGSVMPGGVGMEFGYLAPVFVPDKVANTTPGYEQRRVLDNLELSCD